MLKKKRLILEANYLRNFVFGVEDSLVSTVGLLSGIAITNPELKVLILTGIVLIFVEAFSMGVGSILSEHTAQGYLKGTETDIKKTVFPGSIMFVSYFASGFIPLFPYLFLDYPVSFWTSIIISTGALFVLGYIAATINKIKRLPHAFEMMIIGGVAILLGVAVGSFVNILL